MSTVEENVRDTAGATAPPGLSTRQRWVLTLLCGAQFLLAADFAILNVALPAIGSGLGIGLSDLQWVTTAFALTAASLTLLFGRIGDLFGRRRMFVVGVALLAVASLVGGAAQEPVMLIGARVAQGLATAIVTPAALSLLTTSFPEGPLRERALGLNGALLSAGFTGGALLGGVLTSLLSWRWAFLINVPVCVAILVAVPLLVPAQPARRVRLDVPGAVTVSIGLLSLVYGITAAGRLGWGSPVTLGSLGLGAVLLAAFWLIEMRVAEPLASLRVLRRPSVGWGNLAGLVTFTMASGFAFVMTVYLQQVLRYSALITGVCFGLLGAAAFAGGILAPRFIGRFGVGRGMVVALSIQAVSTGLLFLAGADRTWIALVVVCMTIAGFGHVFAVVTAIVTATSGLPDDQQGLATGLTTLTQQVGLTLGTPILSAVLVARAAKHPLLSAVDQAVLLDGLIVLLGAVLVGLFFVRRPAPAESS